MALLKTLGIGIIGNNDNPNELEVLQSNHGFTMVKTIDGKKQWNWKPNKPAGERWEEFPLDMKEVNYELDSSDITMDMRSTHENFRVNSDTKDVKIRRGFIKKGDSYSVTVSGYFKLLDPTKKGFYHVNQVFGYIESPDHSQEYVPFTVSLYVKATSNGELAVNIRPQSDTNDPNNLILAHGTYVHIGAVRVLGKEYNLVSNEDTDIYYSGDGAIGSL